MLVVWMLELKVFNKKVGFQNNFSCIFMLTQTYVFGANLVKRCPVVCMLELADGQTFSKIPFFWFLGPQNLYFLYENKIDFLTFIMLTIV